MPSQLWVIGLGTMGVSTTCLIYDDPDPLLASSLQCKVGGTSTGKEKKKTHGIL